MNILQENDELIHYFYKVRELCILFENGETIHLDDNALLSFSVINQYIENLFPIIRVMLNLEAGTYYKILKNKKTVKFKIRIIKYGKYDFSESKFTMEGNYVNHLFSLILDDEDVDFERNIREASLNNKEGDLFASKGDIELFLFDSKLMKDMKKTINANLSEVTVNDAISYILSQTDLNNVLMSRPDNQTIYDQMIIPPLKLSGALSYIDTFYGINYAGTFIYFGLNSSYIIKNRAACTAYAYYEKSNVKIIIPSSLSTLEITPCVLEKKQQRDCIFMVSDYKTTSFQDRSITKDILYGKYVRIINLYNDKIETSMDEKKEEEDKREQIIINRGVNPYFMSTYKAIMESEESVISLVLQDIDLTTLTPNKCFSFIIEDPHLINQYKSNYMLVESDTSLIKVGDDYKATASCVFKKG